MKKTGILLLAAVSCSLAFLSCGFNDLQVPKKVKVRTDATYQFSVMNFDSEAEGSKLKLSDYFDLGKTLEEKTGDQSSEDGMKVYKYNDGSQYQQFLIHMPLKEIEFDFSESFKDMDFSKDMEKFNINKKFTVPSIDQPEKTEDIDLSDVQKKLNNGVSFIGSSGNNEGVSFITAPGQIDFSSITYSSGYLYVTSADDANPLTGSVELFDENSNSIASATFNAEGNAALNISGKTFTKNGMTLSFTDTGKDFGAIVDEDSIIKVASGVTLGGSYAPVVSASPISFTFSLPEDIKSCEITDGELEVKINRPGDWANVITEYNIALSGGLSASFTEAKDKETYSPSNKGALSNADIRAVPNVTVEIVDKDLDFENGPSVYAKVTINKISAKVKLADDYEDTIDEGRPVPTDITDYVNGIKWNPSGFDVKAINDLPAGNDITLTFDSDFLDMSNVSNVIVAEGSSASEKTYEYRGGTPTTWFIDVPAGKEGTKYTDMPLTGTIVLNGYSTAGGEKTFVVNDVRPGTTYHLNLVVEPVFDWKEANVKLPEDKTKFNDKMSTGLNKKSLFSALGDEFGEKLNMKSVPLYIFANIPEEMQKDGMKFVGSIKAYYGKDDKSAVTPAVETMVLPAGSEINVDQALPAFVKNEAQEITNDFGSTDLDFATALNLVSNEGSLCLDYNIELANATSDGMDITSTKMEELKAQGKSAVKIDIVLLFATDFSVTDTISIDLMKLMKKQDSDLLGRSEASDMGSIEKYLDVVKSATMEIENLKLPMNGDISLKMDMYKDGSGETKEIANGGSFAMEVNPSQIIKTYPLTPDIQILIGKDGTTSNFGILRTMPVAGKIKLKVKAKGDIPVYPFSEQD